MTAALICFLLRSVLLVLIYVSASAAADPSQDVSLRLETPLASYSKPGTPFSARLLGPVDLKGSSLLPSGSRIHGIVREAHSVGLGLRRERASLALEFQGCVLPEGQSVDCDVRLLDIDNARESVRANNQIHGILAASHPYSWLNGLWFRPAAALLHRPTTGLNGAGGLIYTHLAPGPAGAATIIASRLILFRLPDSEIELPAGTDLIARLAVSETLTPSNPLASASQPAPLALLDPLASVPHEVRRPNREAAGDIINLAFAGSSDDLSRAFEAAGWFTTDSLDARTFARTYSAFAGMKTYSRAPVSTLLYNGRPPDLVFQKSFNSLAKRHHIRLWREDNNGSPFWLGAATHDTGIAFDFGRMSFSHKIDPRIDRERSKVLSDLSAAGCLDAFQEIERPAVTRAPADGAEIVTDGVLVLASLRACDPVDSPAASLTRPRRNLALTALSRFILETRHYLTRGNAYYWTYRAVRWQFSSRRAPVTETD